MQTIVSNATDGKFIVSSTTSPNRNQRGYRLFLGLTLMLALLFWLGAATPYLKSQPETFGRYPELFWPRRYALWLHIFGGTLAIFSGPIQFWPAATRRKIKLHRAVGKVYLLGVVCTCAAAFYLSLTTAVGFVYAAGLFGMSLACTAATAMACLAIRQRNFAQHRQWMIRSYVVIFSFVFFRLIALGLAAGGIGGEGIPGEIARNTLAAWSSWAIPLLLTEVFLQWRAMSETRKLIQRHQAPTLM